MQEIDALEMGLLSRDVRALPEELDAFLADEFIEIGSSGRVYTKDEVIRSLPGEQEAQPLSSDIVLATYRVEKILLEDGRSMRPSEAAYGSHLAKDGR